MTTDNNNGDQLENLEKLKKSLFEEFPESAEVFTDVYLLLVLSAPSRSYERSLEKLTQVMKWRRETNVSSVAPESVQLQLNAGASYWNGHDKNGRPILYVRLKMLQLIRLDVTKVIQMHTLLLDTAIREMMPDGVEQFVFVADCANLGIVDIDIKLARGLLNTFLQGYPERLEKLYVGPVNTFIKVLSRLLKPLMPARLFEKIVFMDNPVVDLADAIAPSATPPAGYDFQRDVLPEFFGGQAKTPSYVKGDNVQQPKFDFDAMVATNRRTKTSNDKEDERDLVD